MSALPQLKLEPDATDTSNLRLVFQPDPSTWSFDNAKGTRDQLREQLVHQVELFTCNAPADARFNEAAQQALRTNVLHLLLQGIGFRGLRIPAGS